MSVKLLVEKDVFVLKLTTDGQTWSNTDSATLMGNNALPRLPGMTPSSLAGMQQ
jgi:hypothetical protein